MTVETKVFPFVKGFDQTKDDRLLDPGTPRSIENLVIEKLGRLRMRYDYDSLQMATGDTNLRLYDLHILGSQLLALTQIDNQDDTAPTNYIQGVHVYDGIAVNAWNRLSQPALPAGARARNVGYIAQQVANITQIDVAAGGGLVGMIWLEDVGGTGNLTAQFRCFNAATGERIGQQFTVFTGFNARVRIIYAGGQFFMCGVNSTTNAVKLTAYDPVNDLRTLITDPLAAQANAITCLDMSLAHEGTSFWIAFGLANTTTGVRGYSTAGAQTFTAAGPAVLADAVTIFAEATNGTNRVNLLVKRNGTNNIDAYTWVPPTTAIALTTANMFTPDTTLKQPSMCMRSANNNHVIVAYQSGNDIQQRCFNDTTHALVTDCDFKLFDSNITSKIMNIRGQHFVGCAEIKSVTPITVTNMLYQFTNLNVAGAQEGRARPTMFGEPGFGALPLATHLSHIGFDVSTALSYWARLYVVEFLQGSATKALPIVSEVALVETGRRQSAQIGPNLYLTGGVTMSIDGTSAAESGGFMVAPRLTSITTGGGGSIATGTYQIVAVFEIIDSQRQRIQGIPSAVFEQAVVGPVGSITLSVPVPHTFWDGNFLSTTRGPGAGRPFVAMYRTKDTGGGNLTFYREKSVAVATAVNGLVSITLTSADASLEQNEILYTQGERGALSGPLPFEVASPSVSIAASADRLLIGGLPDTSNIQESRALFPAEPIQWSQSIGFFRGMRGSVLAVARLDERRIVFTERELFELDGPGLDDNGVGDIGAPRRLPSDVGLFGGLLGWRSIVECSLGIMFQGLADQIYLLARGGTTPQNIGLAVQDKLAAFPTITSAIYCPDDRTVRFTCNNVGNTDGITLIYDLIHEAWVTEGPYGTPTLAGVLYQGRATILQSNIVKQQRTSNPPAAFIANAWRSGLMHPFQLGGFGRVLNAQFYGEYRGDCALRCVFRFDDLTTETVTAEVNALSVFAPANASNATLATYSFSALTVGQPYSFKFHPGQIKCESVQVDFEVDVPFPSIVSLSGISVTTAQNALSFNMNAVRQAGDRAIVVIMVAFDIVTFTPPAGWTVRATGATLSASTAVMERILDGSEAAAVTITWTGTAQAAYGSQWIIRNSHPSAAIEVVGEVGSGTSKAYSLFSTPTWGLANTAWLTSLCLRTRNASASNVTNVPDGIRLGINASQTNASEILNGQVESGLFTQRATSFRPAGTWSWTDSSEALTWLIAVRPNPSIASAGLVYNYFTLDVEGAGKSALKSPLQMG